MSETRKGYALNAVRTAMQHDAYENGGHLIDCISCPCGWVSDHMDNRTAIAAHYEECATARGRDDE